MIELLRIDHRLIHGQTGVFWTAHLHADCILICSDKLLKDPIRLSAVKLSKPTGVKLVIKNVEDCIKAINSGITDKYKLFILTEDNEYAFALMRGCGIKECNLGSMIDVYKRQGIYIFYKKKSLFFILENASSESFTYRVYACSSVESK